MYFGELAVSGKHNDGIIKIVESTAPHEHRDGFSQIGESAIYRNMKSALLTLRLMGVLPYHITSEGNFK